ncbi:MAG: macro domain-containing protein [Clostridia bacterium]|nr:macro domain-containing protein [Clostridia bacterium]
MPFHIVENDLTKMNTDAIVNAANAMLEGGGGVCGAIFRQAGWDEMQAACDALSPVAVGGAVTTPAFGLPQKYVIHAVGPMWQGGNRGEKELLRSAYRSALLEAERLGLSSVAFPLISAGIFGYPKAEALSVAMDTVREFLMEKDEREMEIYLVVLDRSAVELSRKLFGEIERYLETNDYSDAPRFHRFSRREGEYDQIREHLRRQERQLEQGIFAAEAVAPSCPVGAIEAHDECAAPTISLDDIVRIKRESFSERLFRFIDARQLTDAQVYKAANLDRKLFSKIRSRGDAYRPTKGTAIALAIGIGLGVDETQELLSAAGYVLTDSSLSDGIVRYFLERGNPNIFEIETALYRYGQATLSSAK